jgi:hypothetical protein
MPHGAISTFVRAARGQIGVAAVGLAAIFGVLATQFPQAASATSPGPPAELIPNGGVYFGAYVGQRDSETKAQADQRVEAEIGRKLAIDHQYYKWDDAIPTSQETWARDRGTIPFLNWKAQKKDGTTISWSTIASGGQDSVINARADAIKAFGSPLYLTFHHEPEDDLGTWGSPADYAAAFRHVVDVFRSRGVTNVAFVWNMMNWTFDPRSGRNPNEYYPGDGYVDLIGSDGYNWYPGKPGAPWDSFRTIFTPTNDFAVAHDKPWMVVETGVQEDPEQPGRKGQWFTDIAGVAKTWPLLKAVIYFDTVKEYDWTTDSSVSSAQGFAALGRDPYMSASPTGTSLPGLTIRNTLDVGPQDGPVKPGPATAGTPFSQVVTSGGATLTYDDSHALDKFSAKHTLTSGGNAYYQWTEIRPTWYGRLYVWLDRPPALGVRLVRESANKVLRCALDIMPSGILRWVDQYNRTVVATTDSLAFRRWVRIEWMVDHTSGRLTIKLFNSADSPAPTQSVASPTDRTIGPPAQEIQFGRSGSQPFAFTFWTDEPGLSTSGYLGSS